MSSITNDVQHPVAKGWMYLPYCLPTAIAFLGAYMVFFNSSFVAWSLVALLLVLNAVEPLFGEDEETYQWEHGGVFVGMMYLFCLGAFLCFLGFLWIMGHAHTGGDFLNIAAITQAVTGFDMMAAHADNGIIDYFVATIMFSITASLGTVTIGHELAHRTHEPLSVAIARFMGVINLFSYYAVEHPYGHHLTAGTPYDSSTALRGESILQFAKRTFKQDYEIAWEIEERRLKKLGLPVWSHHNRLLRGYAAEALVVLVVAAVGGFMALFFFALGVIQSHYGYKAGVYGQHYGIVRVPDTPLKIHHQWGCTNRVTNWVVDGIGRHADHHLVPEREFWNLLPYAEGPQYPAGYIKTMALARSMKKWNQVMVPKLIEWDEKYASPEEKVLAMEANEKSGIPELIEHAKKQRQELEEAGLIEPLTLAGEPMQA